MSWLQKLLPPKIKTKNKESNRGVPHGLWSKCEGCGMVLYRADFEKNLHVCPKCNHHDRLSARDRLNLTLDKQGRFDIGERIKPVDFLKFSDSKRYSDRLKQAKISTNEEDALVVMKGFVKDLPVVCAAFEFSFMGGSMGSVVGERFVRAIEVSCKEKISFVCFSASGGARMQEGLTSLMQMAKTTSSLNQLAKLKLPFISVLTDPTTGGVSASFAMLGDIVVAEPGALIGFAGPRVIQQTVGETLPEGFQKSEFLLEHGAIDMIVDRREMREKLSNLIGLMTSTSRN